MLHAAHSERIEELEEALRQRVETARERYLAAVSQTGQGGEQTHLIKSDAIARYLRELRVFSDLVMHGRIPPKVVESHSPKRPL